MADFRTIKCSMWREDDWFLDLPTDGKLLWVYLFSNPSASVAGIYRLSLRTMANETGLQQVRIAELLTIFADANKAHFSDGVLWVVKMREHQASRSPKVQARMRIDIASIPKDNPVYRMYARRYGIDTVSIPVRTDTDTDTVTETDTPKDTPAQMQQSSSLSVVSKCWHTHIGIQGPYQAEQLKELVDEFSEAELVEAIPLAQGKQNPAAYVRGVIRNRRKEKGMPPSNGAKPASKLPAGYVLPALPEEWTP